LRFDRERSSKRDQASDVPVYCEFHESLRV